MKCPADRSATLFIRYRMYHAIWEKASFHLYSSYSFWVEFKTRAHKVRVLLGPLAGINCLNVNIVAYVCMKISTTITESTGILVQNMLCCFALIYLLKLFCFDLCNTDKTGIDTVLQKIK